MKRPLFPPSSPWPRAAFLAAGLALGACGRMPATATSDVAVTEVPHTPVKRQSIGNCWLYAQATWLESLYLQAHGETINVSESYWTYWHWYEQIVNGWGDHVETGGFWRTSAGIILRHGFVLEGEFIAGEADDEMSATQARALTLVDAALAKGELAKRENRTPEKVRALLDKAFGVNMADVEAKARKAEDVMVKDARGAGQVSLASALGGGDAQAAWSEVAFPRVYGQQTPVSEANESRRRALLKRVMRALNDRQPVVMSLMVDFNAIDVSNGTFRKDVLDKNGMGSQGGHMVVLDDYTVADVPGYGTLGEGDLSQAEKDAALEGTLRTLVAKNSWGTNRPARGLTNGYSRFDAPYLLSQLAWKNGDGPDAPVSYYTTLTDFVLPPGY